MLTLENERTTHAFMSRVHMSILMHAEKTHGAAKGDVIWVGVGVGLWGLVCFEKIRETKIFSRPDFRATGSRLGPLTKIRKFSQE